MKNKWTILMILTLVFGSFKSSRLHAQQVEKFERISIDDGLSQNTVRAILQDSEGFMWFGTHDGLNKYDGYEFGYFMNDQGDSSTISNNEITSIVEDKDGGLWIGTNGGGLNKYDKRTKLFKRYRHNSEVSNSLVSDFVFSLLIDSENMLWIATLEGVNSYNIRTGKFHVYSQNKGGLSHNRSESLSEDGYGNIWVGTRNGLNKIDKRSGKIKHYKSDPSDFSSLQNSNVRSLYTDQFGDLWLGTLGGGLSKYIHETDQFWHYQITADIPIKKRSIEYITCITEDHMGNLWFGSWGNGVQKLNKETGEMTRYKNIANDPKSLSYKWAKANIMMTQTMISQASFLETLTW
ncbi:MAG: hypothetical protein JKY09_05930, partial [Crocinitomicaceae bacterium]|nr:hypothetical protein [Crocinitomicaceae bacterium]